jgi:hypoxanthine phosphoribosyltransferase
MGDLLTIVFGLIGVVGVGFTIHYGRKSARLDRERKSLSWSDVQLAADDLAEEIHKSGFNPELILSPGARGGVIAEFVAHHTEASVPVLVGITQWKDSGFGGCDLSKYDYFETSKWRVCIPLAVYDNTDKRILIVDDWAMSGDAMERLRSRLLEKGFSQERIRTATAVVTDVAVKAHKAPDHYWRETDSPHFYFPWGKAR